MARSSRRQYLHKVLHVFYVGAQGLAAVRGVVLQQKRAAVLRNKRHGGGSTGVDRGGSEGGEGGRGMGTLSKNGLLKLR